jgi:anaerobic selenocysteine-containing dehydrogenase
MGVKRRTFLQAAAGLVGGAVGGTLLSPLPWKLTDDVAIWTQTDKGIPGGWSWRVSPERGEITEVSSICTLCGGGCGIRASLVNGHRAIAIKGNPQHPLSKGGLCPLGAAGLQFFYAPYRFSQPMKQTKERGNPKGFEKISWDEAIGELGGALSGLKGKAHGVACITGQAHSSMLDLWQQLFAAYGSPNFFTMPSQGDSQKLAASLMLGQEAPFAFALEEASFVLSFGANLLEGWGAFGRMMAAYDEWLETKPFTSPTKFVQVESRCSMTAAKADEWVPIRPGTEAALALGMAHVLIRDQFYDGYFFEHYVFGFESWLDRDDWKGEEGKRRKGFKDIVMAEYSPAKVAEITGVEAGKIERLAKEFARHKKAIAVWGNGIGTYPNNFYHDMVFVALNALVGNLKPDGLLSLVPQVPLAPLPEIPKQESKQPRLDLANEKFDLMYPGNALYFFLDTLRSEKPPYPIELLMIHEANPAHSLPENKFFNDAIKKVGKVVSFSSYMDETAQQADLILPNHSALELLDDVKGLPGTPYAYYAVASPILKPQLDTKHTGDVLLTVAKKLGGNVKNAMPWDNYEAYLKERVEGLAATGKGAVADKADVEPWKLLTGQSPEPNYKDEKDLWAKLAQGMPWYDGPRHILEGLDTKSDRVELVCQAFLKTVDLTEWENILLPVCMRNKEGKIELVPCEPPPPKPKPPQQDDEIFLPRFIPPKPSGEESEYPLWLMSYKLIYLANGYLPNPPFMTKTLWDNLLRNKEQFVEIHPKTAQDIKMLGGTVREGDHVDIKTPHMEAPVRARLRFSNKVPQKFVFVADGLGHTAYDEFIRDKGINANEMVEVLFDRVTGLGGFQATRAKVSLARPGVGDQTEKHS